MLVTSALSSRPSLAVFCGVFLFIFLPVLACVERDGGEDDETKIFHEATQVPVRCITVAHLPHDDVRRRIFKSTEY